METTFRPISKRRLDDLRGTVAIGTTLFRGALFAAAVSLVAWSLSAAHRSFVPARVRHAAWWIVPTVLFAAFLYRRAAAWTGGRALRAAIRQDIAGGVAAVHRIRAMDAIEIEEQGDSGPGYLVKTDDGARLAFVGQYLERYRAKGFPWTEFEILEAPRSKLFFGLVKIGARLPPSAKRAPLGWDEYQRLAMGNRNYRVLDPDHWDALARAVRPGTGDRETTPRGEGT